MRGTHLPRLPVDSWIAERTVQAVFAALDGDGEVTRAVGGAVRDALVGRRVADVDFATTALPEIVAERAAAAGLKAVPTGVEHGTLTLVVESRPFQVTTLRADVETYGRRAKVVFGRDWQADAARRDFTINALYADREGGVHDPLGGYPDVKARRVRFIGDAGERIREDALRILRFFRFTAEYGWGPVDHDGLLASMRERRLIDRLSRERVRQELFRLVSAPRAAEVLATMAESGLLTLVLKGVPHVAALARLGEIERALGRAPEPVERLAALAVRIQEDAERLSQALRLSRREDAMLGNLATLMSTVPFGASERVVKRFLFAAREKPATASIRLAWAISSRAADDPQWRALYAEAEGWRPPSPPFKGADFLALGLKPGPAVGRALARLKTAWIEAGFPDEPTELEQLKRQAVAEMDLGSE